MYYTSLTSTNPIISIRHYIEDSGMVKLNDNFENIDLDAIMDFNAGFTLNDIMKINDNKVCIASASSDKNRLYLIFLNLFENDTKMVINYYMFYLSSLNHKIYKEIQLFLYNDFISFGFNHCPTTNCEEETDTFYSSLIISIIQIVLIII